MGTRKELEIPDELYKLAKEEFDCNWNSKKVVIKRFKFGDQVQLQQDSMKIKSTQMVNFNAEVNIADVQILTIMRAVVEAPWLINDVAAVKDLPGFIAEWLKQEIEEFNTITLKKKEN